MKDISKPSLLLHCCCAPCACSVVEQLSKEYKIALFFYNPNIEPHEEYIKREVELKKFIDVSSFTQDVRLVECEYDNDIFVGNVLSLRDQPENGARCNVCFDLRLDETARRAKEDSFDVFTTTLSVGPRKNAKLLNEIGLKVSKKYSVTYLEADFKKRDGYKRSIELSKQYGLYRQNYCGCLIGHL